MPESKKLPTDISITVAGAAGEGSRAAAEIIAKTFLKAGYFVYIYEDYQSLIRGGHNFAAVRCADKPIYTHKEKTDILIALNEDGVEKHKENLEKDGIIIYNSDKTDSDDENAFGIPADQTAKEIKAKEIMANTAMAAAAIKATGLNSELIINVIKENFEKEVSEKNARIAEKAYNFIDSILHLKKIERGFRQTLITGNQSAALGATKAGMSIYFAYPMTPATGILHFLAENETALGIKTSQPENEIAVINMALGAAYSGARTMIGTSGGGFALMTEALSMATMNEIPLLIAESQRMSPASGVPTYNGQGDLAFAINAGHGDIVKFTAAPADAEETYLWSGILMNLSWKYQTPSILLIDKQVSESTYCVDEKVFDEISEEKISISKEKEYQRYKIEENGISPLAFPGKVKGSVKSNSYEHDEKGITVEDPDEVLQMQEKRLLKFEKMADEAESLESVKVYGDKKADKAVITWGSSKGPVKEAVEKTPGFKLIQIILLEPFPLSQVSKALEGVSELISVEANSLGQLSTLLRQNGIYSTKEILKYDARPFVPEEITEKLKS